MQALIIVICHCSVKWVCHYLTAIVIIIQFCLVLFVSWLVMLSSVEENTKIRNVTKDRNFGAKITYVSNISNLHNYENQ